MNHKYFWLRVVTLIGIVLNLLGPMAVMPVYAETIIFTGEELLGRPTDTSITINIVPDTTIEYYYEYGTSSGSYTGQTSPVTATGGQPHEVTITGLDPDTRYYYRMIYDGDGDVEDGDYETRTEHTFHTQRAEGESFVFTVTSDSHGNFSANTATNILNNGPDFHVDLGDTFMVDNVSPTSQSAYNARYEQWRGTSYFGGIGQSVPIYLTPGNHEEEEGWNLDDTPSRALFNIEARKLYFPMPNDDGFYSASTDTLADLSGDQLRENYYAWEWGDALFVVIDEFQYTMELPYAPGAAGEGTDDPQTGDQWSWTLGEIQYNWLKQTLTSSDAKYKFVFSHNMLGGIPNLTVAGVGPGYVRGGAKGAPYFEWGGYNGDDSWGFDTERPGWDKPIHQLFIENGVSAYFHGHDHQYVYETRDGVVYQEVPSAGNMTGFSDIYTEGDYTDFYGDYSTVEILPSAGHLRISVTPAEATVDYIAASGGGVNYSYTIAPNQTADPDYFITATAGANGSISPSGLVGVVAGNDQSFTITPDPSYQVADVLVDGGSVGAVTEYTFYDVTADHTIAASFVAAPPTGEVTVDGTASSATGDEVAVLSFAHTTGSGENRLLLVGIAWNSGSTERDITSVVFNDGTTDHPLSVVIDEQATSTTAPRNAAIYSLLNPPAGASGTVTVTFSGDVSNGIVAGAVNFAGVNQTIPLGTPNGGTASSSAAPTVTLNGLNGDELVFDTVFQGASNETQTLTPGVDQTEQWNAWIANVRAAASVKQATSGSVTMSWTAASSAVWVIAAVPINPAPAGTTYELTMASDGNGTTSPTMGVHTYAENAVVSLSATPNTGYVFDSWTGDADCADGSVTMNADKTCAATFVAAPPTGEVTLDGAVSSATGDDVSSLSFAHTTGTGSNRLLLVGVSWNCGSNNRTISSVTFTPDGGSAIALAQVITQLGYNTSNPRYSAIYSLLAPPSGQAGTVTITFSGSVSNGIMAGAANFAGVDQSTPLGTPASANDNSTTPSVELTGLNGDELVFDHVFLGASSSSYELTVGSDQTQLWNPAYVANLRAAASTEQATSGSVTMSWTASTGNYWAIAAVPINPAPTTPICYALVLSHTGQGTDPVASPANSTGCPAGEYVEGESISLSDAEPDIDWQISSWTGTANDSSTADTNSLTMPASAHTASVNYTIIPIVPICVTSRIGASSDDAEERNDTGAVDLDGDTSTHSLQMYRAYGGGSTGTLNWWGLRFLNVNVPQGAIITSATVTFRANNDSDATDSGMTLWGQLAANPGTFTDDDDNITDRTRTTTTAAWSVPQWTSGSDYATPSLTAIVQELVDQPGWVANNAMVIIGQTTESQNRSAISYNSTDGETLAPLIEVCYQMPTGPTIYTSGTLNAFSTTPGTPSDAQTYTVSGNNLSEDILITAPAGFELSVDDINYSNNLILAHAGGSVSTTTVYVRLTGADEGTFSGNIVHTSNAATQVDIAVSGEVAIAPTVTTFQQGIDGYAGTVDTYLESGDADADNSTATTLVVDLDPEQHILLRFDSIFGNDPGQIPPGAIIQSALLEINVTNASDEGALLHRMLQPWNDTDTWNTWGGGIDADGIEARTTADSSSSGSSTGTATIDVTTDVQVWSNNPSSSFGWAWLPPSGDDSWQFRSAEGSTPPKLTVTYFPSSTEPPAAPTDLSATAVSSTRIDLGWTDNSDDETGFEVWSAASDGTPNGLLETVGGNTATYSNTGLDPNTEYCYVVRAINGAGESAYTGVACATTQAAPTTVTIQVRVNQSSDDAEENLSDNSVTIDSSDLEMIHESQIDDYDQEVGMRFQNVQVPAGATIVSAHIVFVADASSGGDGASALTIYGEAADNPAPFEETDENITGRTKTTASMAWNPGTWASGQTYQTSDLTTIVQEIIARGGWISGNAMVFIVTGAPDDQVRAESHDGSSAAAPLLVIEYATSTGPLITLTGTPLNAFSTTPGIPSTAQTYIVSGSNLEADISITAPAGFELSLNGSTYVSNLTLPQIGGTVGATTIYVRLTGAEGTFGGDITHESANAATKNVAVSGTAGWCVTVSFQQGVEGYAGARDTHVRQADPTFNYGATTPLTIDSDEPYGDGYDASALLYWDLSAIPTGSTVESASITVYVENVTESPGYDMYEMTQAWTEGTGDGSVTGDGATWETYDGTNAWPNGAGGASDRGSTALANFAATSTGSYQVALNDAGEAVLENWINTPANNMGFMIHAGEEDNGLDFTTKEGSTAADRPKLTISYCLAPTTPYIAVSGTLSPFFSTVDVPSDEQSYTVLGLNLTDDLVIIAPADFEISTTSGSSFGPSVSLTPDGEGTVAATTIYVHFLRSTNGTSGGNITHTSLDATPRNVPVSGTATSAAPVVSLPQPADDATGVSIPPTLEVTVTDPEEDPMSVSFYGRPVGGSGGEDFTIFVYPDTQSHVGSESGALIFNAMSDYVVAQQTAFNVAFATHVGDIVNTANDTAEWQRADAAMDILDPAGIPYSVGPGNHDDGGYTSGATYYPNYFGTDRFSGKPWYGGYYDSDNFNNYSLFSASGMDFIVINLQYNSTSAHWDWADALLKANPARRGIVAQHNILNVDNSWQSTASQNLYNALQDNPNLFLMLCGHMHSGSDGSAYRLETRTGVDPVHILLTDYQDYNSSGNTGYMRILTFKPATDEIYAQIYSPYVDAYLTSESNYEQFTMTYDMDGSAPFGLIDTVDNVTSGNTASISWPGLNEGAEYEWYATVSDGGTTITGDIWSFTTESVGPTCYNLALSHTGNGSTPIADPTHSSGCSTGQYIAGESVNLSGATPDTGWYIASWSGTANDTSTAGSNSLTMPANNHAASVLYAINTYTLDYAAGTGGTLTGDASQTVTHGGSGTAVTAVPNTGYHFVEWSDGVTTATRTDTNVTANVDVTATFAISTYTLNYTAGTGGTLTGDASQTVTHGSSGTAVTALPNTGYHFVEWSDGVTTATRTDTNVTANVDVTATFAINTYTLNYTAGTGGTLTGNASQTVTHGGSGTAVTAVPNTGYHFVDWSDGVTDNPRTDTNVTADVNVTANFAINTYTLNYTAGTGGTLTGDASQTVSHGGSGTPITAVPNTGYHFVEWSDGITDNPRTDTNVTANVDVTATFTQNEYTLTVISEHGTVTRDPQKETYHYGDTVILTATANTGWSFAGWEGDVTSTDNPVNMTIHANTTITATYTELPPDCYALSLSHTGQGSTPTASPAKSAACTANGQYVAGEDITLSGAAPDTGWHIASWTGTANDASTATSNTLTMPAGDHATSVIYAINTYTLNYTAGTGGTLSGNTSQTVTHGSSGTAVTAVPNTGYHFMDWSDGVTDNPRTDTNVTADVNVTANYAINTYTLTYAAGTGGALTGDASQVVEYGGSGTPVTATANTGYHFVQWSDGITDNPRTDTNVTANVDVTATFAINTYTLNYTAGTGGTLSGNTSQTVSHGGSGTAVTAVPNTGYHFVEWSDGVTTATRTDTNVTANVDVTANFAINTYTLDYAAGTGGTLTGDASQTVTHGSSGTPITAVPNTGYHFVEWSDGVTTATRTDTNVTANVDVTATFTQNEYTLTVISEHGTVTRDPQKDTYHYNDVVVLTATAATGYSFAGWSGDVTSTDNPVNITIHANTTITATYTELPPDCYALSLSHTGQGSTPTASPAKSAACTANGQYVAGEDITLSGAAPDTGWHIASWTGTANDASTATSNTLTMPASNHAVSVNYAQNEYTLTVNTVGTGTVVRDPNKATYHYGDVVTLTAKAGTGWAFTGWSDDLGTNEIVSISIESNTVVTATFAQLTYGVMLVTEEDALSGEPGEIIEYTLTLTNTGNSTDTFVLACAGNTWDVLLPGTSFALDAGKSARITVSVTIPANAKDGDTDAMTVVATSQGNASTTASVKLTTTAEESTSEPFRIFLPLVMQNNPG